MSERGIEVGDLVIVLRNHCSDMHVGEIYDVSRIESSCDLWCSTCMRFTGPGTMAVIFVTGGGLPIQWLKRIPPLVEPESITQRDEVTV